MSEIRSSLNSSASPTPPPKGVTPTRRTSLTVIIKPTNACNLACKYCYVDSCAGKGMMSKETLHNAMTQAAKVANGRKIHFIWHGGEPLLAGMAFFERVGAISKGLRDQGYLITNGIQTNGTLVNDELLDFIEKQQDFELGFSLDGPKSINDQTRVYKDGLGAFDAIFASIKKTRERAKQKNAPFLGGGVIVVVSQTNLSRLSDIYQFFRSEKIGIRLNPVIISGRAGTELSISPLDYATAMNELFDIWIEDPASIDVDPFSTMMGNLLTSSPLGCQHTESCAGNFVAIGPQGDVYPCGRFDGVPEYRLGNVNSPGGLKEALTSGCHQRLKLRSVSNISGCKECEFAAICNGGCLHNATTVGDPMGRDPFCVSYKLMYSHIKNFLVRELENSRGCYAKLSRN